jgi:hypothetical protein
MKPLLTFLAGAIFTLLIQWSGYAPTWMQSQRNLMRDEMRGIERRIVALSEIEKHLKQNSHGKRAEN